MQPFVFLQLHATNAVAAARARARRAPHLPSGLLSPSRKTKFVVIEIGPRRRRPSNRKPRKRFVPFLPYFLPSFSFFSRGKSRLMTKSRALLFVLAATLPSYDTGLASWWGEKNYKPQ